jgi:hypothetical protein
MDPNPSIFITDLQDANKKLIKKNFFLSRESGEKKTKCG